ncbi:amino acid adenylation domain-containing protein/thioester reductase-like protein [Paenibacillus rhizosphaerae]|uniref:Amino acid adenylation domain-containing protein/thioester reductase-like protein n=1 Tax=Paenibacillus rhizosphaerae TaxID=297318 RepID=A0A839TIL9_9BACL|nr:non-ribosomal peptide synthetase [Paenibacillus rhizosphaerae]MBB3126353.1 amino acid adenylation domain-containing protein/thioester reductase-like protein [Paenibacillus rhizosphaerae]
MNTTSISERSKAYWSQELELPLPGLNLYTDEPVREFQPDMLRITETLDVGPEEAAELSRLGNPRVWWLASYAVFLYRMSADQDLLFGVVNRQGVLLPLRAAISGQDTFRQVYARIEAKLEALDAADLSLQELEEMIGQPLGFHAVYGEAHASRPSWLGWDVQAASGGWTLSIAYARQLFREQTVRKFSRHYVQIVRGALQNADLEISRLPFLLEEDRAAYTALNDTQMDLPDEPTIVRMMASTVAKYPDRIAVTQDGKKLTYEQLDRQSNRIANMLLSKGLQKGQFVPIFMKRSLETIVCMLGVIKAGGAYIPLDPSHPDERNAYIIADTQTGMILTQAEYVNRLETLLAGFDRKPEILPLGEQADSHPEEACPVDIEPDDLAYIIYTSGSTGKPKGALIAHQGVVNLAESTRREMDLTEEDVILQYSTFSFDASVYDIFGSLACGSRLHLLTDEERFSIDAFTAAVVEQRATRVAILPTVFFNQLAAHLPEEDAPKYGNIQSIIVGGEALSGEAVRMLQKKLQVPVVNLYGPTEITAVATSHIVDYPVPEDLTTVYIGTPLSNYELYIVSEHDQLCPIGVTGELLISSVGVGKGYLNQPEKTKEAFITDPITPESGKKFYRSGDMVRLLPDGLVEYRGRKDAQVKIRGFRIEIGEIEDNLAKYESVKDIAVIPRTEADGTKILAAFYTSNDGRPVPSKDLTQFLSQKVPGYMVPKYMCFVDQMPLSPTGKIDRKKLAAFEIVPEEDDSPYEAPVTAIQKEVAAAWEKALGQTRIGIHDDFFEIGGYSLKILEILVLLKPNYPQLKINDFFVYPTIAALASRIEVLAHSAAAAEEVFGEDVPLQDLAEFPLSFYPQDHAEGRGYTQENILLTGATGYLGSHLLYELLRQSKASIYCLVRPSGEREPYARLEQTMIGYFGNEMKRLMDGRVIAVQGDLEQEHLGMNREVWDMLADRLDSILHCGAEVKHFGEADYFARVNVDSTNRLLALAKSKPGVRFHFISTLGIPEDLALNGQWASITAGSGYDEAYVENVYTNSKLAAEKLVVQAGREGLEASVYRVGNLSCRSDNGLFQKNIDNNAFYRMLKAMLLLKKAPDVCWEVDMTPINYAGEAITALALQDATVGRMFHICNPATVAYRDMVRFFQAYGYTIDLTDWKEYEQWLLDPKQAKDQTGLELAMAQLEGDGAKNSNYRYACPQTLEYLEGTGVQCAQPDEAYFRKLIAHAIKVEYFTRPE